MSSDLKPCPFCGSDMTRFSDDIIYQRVDPPSQKRRVERYYCVCPQREGGCGARAIGQGIEGAASAWNRRADGGSAEGLPAIAGDSDDSNALLRIAFKGLSGEDREAIKKIALQSLARRLSQ